MEVYLSNVNYKLGTMTDIEEIRQLKKEPASLKYLKNLGIARYSKMELPARECIKDVSSRFLDTSGVAAKDVDGIIFFSTMFDIYKEYDDLAVICQDLGFSRAIPFGMFLNQCTNYTQALMFAKSLILNDGYKNILLIGSDRSDDAKDYRVMPNNTSVYSDVAVCALVSSEIRKGYVIHDICHRFLPEMARISTSGNIIDFIEKYSLGFSTVCKDMYAKMNRVPGDYKHLVTANYNHSVVKNLISLAGMKPGSAFTENIGRLAHCFSADQLIATEDMKDGVTSGSLLNLVAVGGFWVFSSMCLEKA